MKKLFATTLTFVSVLLFSQNYIASYRLAYKPDSTNRSDIHNEDFRLALYDDHSIFISEGKYKRDSAIEQMKNLPADQSTLTFGMSVLMRLPKSAMREIITKDYHKHDLVYYGEIAMTKLFYTETPNFQWKILPDKKKIAELDCQEATLHFAGRDYIAWFSTELPFPDGPYKFSGLPGLIVEIYDIKDDYHYQLVNLKKAKINDQNFSGYAKTTKERYYKAYEEFRNDPEAILSLNSAAMGSKVSLAGGNPASSLKERWKKRNNPIELSP